RAKLMPRNEVTIPMTFSHRSFVVAEIIWEYRESGRPISPATAPGTWVSSIQPRMSARTPIVTEATASQPWSGGGSGLPSRSTACRVLVLVLVSEASCDIGTLLIVVPRVRGTRCTRDPDGPCL